MKKLFPLCAALCVFTLLLAACAAAPSAPAPTAAPVPAYDKAELELSEYNGTEISSDVLISFQDEIPGAEEVTLTYQNQTGSDYHFTALQRLEARLDGDWYIVPDSQDFVTMQLLTLPGNSSVEDVFRLEGRYEPLPSGTYRILKDFSTQEGDTLTAAVEFTIE